MAFFDQNLLLSSAQSLSSADAASTNVYDITGAGVGTAPSQIYGINPTTGAATLPGADIGAGDGNARPTAFFTISTAGTGSGTYTFAVQAAPGLSNNTEGTYITLASSAAYVGTTLTAGRQIYLPIPPQASGTPLPRFYRFYYTHSGTVTMSVTAGILLNPPVGLVSTLYPPNFVATL